MSVACLFPLCSDQLEVDELDEHIRRHFHYKPFRCYCLKKFYTDRQLQEHFGETDDKQIHCKMPEVEEDCYLNGLVLRMVNDCKSKTNGVAIPLLTSNLRAKVQSIDTPARTNSPASSTSSMPIRYETTDVRNKRSTPESQEETIPAKKSRFDQTRPSRQRNNSLSVERFSRSPFSNESCSIQSLPATTTPTLKTKPILSNTATPGINRSGGRTRSRERTSASALGIGRMAAPTLIEPPPLSNTRPSQGDQQRTIHDAITEIIGTPGLNKERLWTLPPELSKLCNVTCLKCPSVTRSFSVDFKVRRTHAANKHVSANQANWKFAGDYRKELAYQTRECFPDLASEDDICVVCHDTTLEPTRYATEAGRLHHIRACHLPEDRFLPCPYATELESCRVYRFKHTDDVNKHCQIIHMIDGYVSLRETKRPMYEEFLYHKRIFNKVCSDLKSLYFPIPLPFSPSSSSLSEGRKSNDNTPVATVSESNDNTPAVTVTQNLNVKSIKLEEPEVMQIENGSTKSLPNWINASPSRFRSRSMNREQGSWRRPLLPNRQPLLPNRQPLFPNRGATFPMGGRSHRGNQIRPNHHWHYKGNKF